MLFTFVYVNDGCIHDETFGHCWHGLDMVQLDSLIEIIEVGLFIRTLTRENNYKGATMKKAAFYAGLFAVLASPFAALAAPAAQSSMKADSDGVTITGRVSCSRFGGSSVQTSQRG